jgi:hypothetical protein
MYLLDDVLAVAEKHPFCSQAQFPPNDEMVEPNASDNDFTIDTRMVRIETIPLEYDEGSPLPKLLPKGETNIIVQTVLTRLHNPVICYLTGDIGSLHCLSDRARSHFSETDWPCFRVLRLQCRDQHFSFMWGGIDIRFDRLSILLSEAKCEILQWQVILHKMVPSLETSLEVGLLYPSQYGRSIYLATISDKVCICDSSLPYLLTSLIW